MPDLWIDFYSRLEKFTEGKTCAESFNYATHVSLKYNYLFVETPKVACSTIKLSLQRLELEMADLQKTRFEDVHVREFSPLLMLTQLPNFEDYLLRNDFFKFCFVRNPYDRLLSCYLDKIVNYIDPKEKQNVLKHLGENIENLDFRISFHDFVRVIEKQTLLEMDYHWRPQTYLTCQSTIEYDFIGKLESFDDDINKISNFISPMFKQYFLNEVRHKTNANKQLIEYYDTDLFKRVFDIYEADFVNFSYNKLL